jgi:hypothetical protein
MVAFIANLLVNNENKVLRLSSCINREIYLKPLSLVSIFIIIYHWLLVAATADASNLLREHVVHRPYFYFGLLGETSDGEALADCLSSSDTNS